MSKSFNSHIHWCVFCRCLVGWVAGWSCVGSMLDSGLVRSDRNDAKRTFLCTSYISYQIHGYLIYMIDNICNIFIIYIQWTIPKLVDPDCSLFQPIQCSAWHGCMSHSEASRETWEQRSRVAEGMEACTPGLERNPIWQHHRKTCQ